MKWLEIAKQLPVGGKTDGVCPEGCGSGSKLSINHSVKTYWCNCYRCGFTEQVYKGKQTLEELRYIRELNERASTEKLTLELPHDYTTEIPLEGRLWLYKGGITETVWRKYRFGYSKTMRRVILPVYDSKGNLIWYQCRALLEGQSPKYVQPARSRDTVYFLAGAETRGVSEVVIVEDILSAVRVGKFKTSCSLLGTKITTSQANFLGKFDRVIVWLDADRAGQSGATKISRTLGLATEVKRVRSAVDPKALTDQQIQECLSD